MVVLQLRAGCWREACIEDGHWEGKIGSSWLWRRSSLNQILEPRKARLVRQLTVEQRRWDESSSTGETTGKRSQRLSFG